MDWEERQWKIKVYGYAWIGEFQVWVSLSLKGNIS